MHAFNQIVGFLALTTLIGCGSNTRSRPNASDGGAHDSGLADGGGHDSGPADGGAHDSGPADVSSAPKDGGGDGNIQEGSLPQDASQSDGSDAAPSPCHTSVIDNAVPQASPPSVDVAYDGTGEPHVVYIKGYPNGTAIHAVRSGNSWSSTSLPDSSQTARVAISTVGGVPWVAAAQNDGSTFVYTPGAEAGTWQETFDLAGDTSASMVALKSAVDANGGYHLMALMSLSGYLAFKHLKPGQSNWDIPYLLTTSSFGTAGVTLAGDGSMDVVWTDKQGGIWEYNDHAGGTGITELSSTASAATGVAVASKSLSDGSSILYGTTTAWNLLHAGSSGSVLQGNTAPGDPALVQSGGALFGAVYQPMGNFLVQTSLVTSSGGPWTVLTDAANARAAAVAIRANGQPAMAIRRDYQSPEDSDVALVECQQ